LKYLKKWEKENFKFKSRLYDLQSEELLLMERFKEVRQEIEQVRKRLRKD